MTDRAVDPTAPALDARSRGEPLWIDSPDGPLFGLFHSPVGGSARASVLICPSLASEQIAGYAACRELANQLARAGFAVLRFDYFGTGNSAGDLVGDGVVSVCQRGVTAASEWLQRACDGPMIVVGLRMGGTLAVSTIRSGSLRPDGVVLWDPAKSGKRWLRNQILLHRMYIRGRAAEPEPAPEGVEVAGFLYDEPLASALASLRLGQIGQSLASRLLLLGDGVVTGTDSEPWPGLTTTGATDRAGFLDVSTSVSDPPTATTALIVDWFEHNYPSADYPLNAGCGTRTAVLARRDGVIRERAVRLGSKALFGVACEPDGPTRGPIVIFLNAGIEPHIGPARLWVDLSRRWAAMGVRCVRVDLSGLGESDATVGENDAVPFAGDFLTDMRQIAGAVSTEGPSALIWIGLCSGAYHALEAAAGIGAAGAFVVNPALVIAPPDEDHKISESWRRMCRFIPEWVLDYSLAPETYIKSKRHIAGLAYRVLYRLGLMPAPASGLRQLSRNSGNTVIVAGPFEAKPLLWLRLGRRVGLYRNARLNVISDLQHSLLNPGQREQVTEMATRWLLDEVIGSAPVDNQGSMRDGNRLPVHQQMANHDLHAAEDAD